MHNLQSKITDYLNYCQTQKRLDTKTLKAYRIDLGLFVVKYNYRKLQMRIGECCISKLEKVAKHSLKTLRNGVAPEW